MARYRRRRADVWTLLAATALTVLCSWAVSSGDVGPVEEAVFDWVNRWPDWLEEPLWLFQLVGVLGMPLLVAIPALALRRWRLVVALVLLVPLKLLVHGEQMKGLVQRERPGSTLSEVVLRDVPSAGVAYPSGHAVITAGIVVLLAPYVRRRSLAVLIALALLNSVARVFLGAHAPLDVVGGAAVGAAIGAALNLLVGVPVSRRGAVGPGPGSRASLPAPRVTTAPTGTVAPAAPRQGLTAAGAASRRPPGGNRLPVESAPSPVRLLVAQLVHFFALLLRGAAVLALVGGMPQLAVAIAVVVVLNGVFAVVQEYRADRAAEALRDLVPHRVTVLRDGVRQGIDAVDVVIGDVLALAAGDRIAADLRLTEVHGLRVDESSHRGEPAGRQGRRRWRLRGLLRGRGRGLGHRRGGWLAHPAGVDRDDDPVHHEGEDTAGPRAAPGRADGHRHRRRPGGRVLRRRRVPRGSRPGRRRQRRHAPLPLRPAAPAHVGARRRRPARQGCPRLRARPVHRCPGRRGRARRGAGRARASGAGRGAARDPRAGVPRRRRRARIDPPRRRRARGPAP